jgi:hypothetical protein
VAIRLAAMCHKRPTLVVNAQTGHNLNRNMRQACQA